MAARAVAGGHEIRSRAAFGEDREALGRLGQILDPGGRDNGEVLVRAAKSGRVDQKPATAGEEEIGHQRRLAGGDDRLHHLHPIVHLVDEIAVDAIRFGCAEELLGVLRAVANGGKELDLRAESAQRRGDALDVRSEVVADVGPRGALLLDREAGEDQANPRTPCAALGRRSGEFVGRAGRLRPRKGQHRGRAQSAAGRQETTPARAATTAEGRRSIGFHDRLPTAGEEGGRRFQQAAL